MILLYIPIVLTVILIMAIIVAVPLVAALKVKVAVEGEIEKQVAAPKLQVNEDSVSALMQLGFRKKESIEATRRAMEKVGKVKVEVLIREALKNV